jgi:hypothetical protein
VIPRWPDEEEKASTHPHRVPLHRVQTLKPPTPVEQGGGREENAPFLVTCSRNGAGDGATAVRVVGGAGLECTMDGEGGKGTFDAVETAVELLRRGARQKGAFRVWGSGFGVQGWGFLGHGCRGSRFRVFLTDLICGLRV